MVVYYRGNTNSLRIGKRIDLKIQRNHRKKGEQKVFWDFDVTSKNNHMQGLNNLDVAEKTYNTIKY